MNRRPTVVGAAVAVSPSFRRMSVARGILPSRLLVPRGQAEGSAAASASEYLSVGFLIHVRLACANQ